MQLKEFNRANGVARGRVGVARGRVGVARGRVGDLKGENITWHDEDFSTGFLHRWSRYSGTVAGGLPVNTLLSSAQASTTSVASSSQCLNNVNNSSMLIGI